MEFQNNVLAIPCHSQAVERCVAYTSEAAKEVVGYHNRHSFIINKMESTKLVPTHAGKNDFVTLAIAKEPRVIPQKPAKQKSIPTDKLKRQIVKDFNFRYLVIHKKLQFVTILGNE